MSLGLALLELGSLWCTPTFGDILSNSARFYNILSFFFGALKDNYIFRDLLLLQKWRPICLRLHFWGSRRSLAPQRRATRLWNFSLNIQKNVKLVYSVTVFRPSLTHQLSAQSRIYNLHQEGRTASVVENCSYLIKLYLPFC